MGILATDTRAKGVRVEICLEFLERIRAEGQTLLIVL